MAAPVNYYSSIRTVEDTAGVDSAIAGWDLLAQQSDFVNRKYAESTPFSLIARKVFFGGSVVSSSGSGTYASPAIPSTQTGFTIGSDQKECALMMKDSLSPTNNMLFIPTMVGLMHHPLARINELASPGDKMAIAVGNSTTTPRQLVTPFFDIAPSSDGTLVGSGANIYGGTSTNGGISTITTKTISPISGTTDSGSSSPYIVRDGNLRYQASSVSDPNLLINSDFDSAGSPLTPNSWAYVGSGIVTGAFGVYATRTITSSSATQSYFTQTVPVVNGQSYTFTYTSIVSAATSATVGDFIGVVWDATTSQGSQPTIKYYRHEAVSKSLYLAAASTAVVAAAGTEQRFSVTFIANSTTVTVKMGLGIATARVTTVSVYNPQIETGLAPSVYVKSSTSTFRVGNSTVARPSMYYFVPIYPNIFSNPNTPHCGGSMMRSFMNYSTTDLGNNDRYAGSQVTPSNYGLGTTIDWNSIFVVWGGHTRNGFTTATPTHAAIRLSVFDLFGVIISPHA